MFIDDQTYKTNGKTYRRVLLRNSYRKNGKICHDTIASLTKCTDEEIEAFKWALKNKDKISSISDLSDKIKTCQGLQVGAVWLLHSLCKRIGIAKSLGNSKNGKLAQLMVIASMIGHNSRLSIVRLTGSHAFTDILGLDSFTEDHLYNSMDWLADNQDEIEDKLFKIRSNKSKPILYLYDVTSSYLEGDKNELAAYGYNRDKKKGKKQIVIGLLIEEEGYPISIQVFDGNTSDTMTFNDQIEKVKSRFGCEKVVIVGDRGMIKTAGISALNEANLNFITAITKAQITTLLKNKVFQMDMFDEELMETVDDNFRYILRRNPIRMKEIGSNRDSKLQSLNVFLEKQNQYLENHQRARAEVALKKLIEKSNKLLINKWTNISIEDKKLKLEIHEKAKNEISKLDGCYVIKTDLKVQDASKEKVHSRYKDLANVEWGFRTMKGALLEMRGIFVRKGNRTRAHIFNVMLGYMLYFHLAKYWQDLEVTIEEGINELASISSVEIEYQNGKCQTIPKPRELGKDLLKKANVTLPTVLPIRNAKVATRTKLAPKRKIRK